MRISYSSLDTYRSCPQKFEFQEIKKIKAPKSIEALFGSAVHSSLKRMFQRQPLYPSLDEVLDFFNNKWSEAKNITTPEILKAYFEDGVELISNFYKKNSPWNFNALELETFFETHIEDPIKKEKHILVGKIDRIDKLPGDGEYEIIDYKTSKKMPSKDTVDADLQLSIYNLGLLKRWPHLKTENIKLSLYYLRHNEKIGTKRTPADLLNTKNKLLELINEIQDIITNKKEFIATPSALCDWCGYKKICPMWMHLYQNTNNLSQVTNGDMPALISEYFELKARNTLNNRRVSEIQAQISEFMSKQGISRVFGENGYFTRISQERTVLDMDKIKAILAELGRLEEVTQKKQYSTLKATKKKIKTKKEGE